MKKKELIKLLTNLPDDANIWIGADTGEGWIQLDEVFSCSAIDAPLDGDEVSHEEIDYLDRGDPIENSWEIEDDDPRDKEVRVGKPIIVVGERGSQREVESNREYRNRDKKAERLKTIAAHKKELQDTIKTLNKEMSNLVKKR